MDTFENLYRLSVASLVRDRLLYLIFSLAVLALVLIPPFSMFSMRQVQELSVTLCLSALSFLLLVVTVLTGSSSIWRDLEKRYAVSVLGLPVPRRDFVLGKFCAISTLLAVVALLFAAGSFAAVKVATALYPSEIPTQWSTFAAAVLFTYLKYVLLLSLAFVFSAVSTSFYFPFLASIAVFIAGSASQEVYEYVLGPYGERIAPVTKVVIKGVYYLLPNFAAFDLNAQAIYSLPLVSGTLLLTLGYFVCYTGIMLCIAVWSFSGRELP